MADTTPPSLGFSYPGTSTAIQLSAPLVLTFSEAIQPDKLVLTLQGPSGTATFRYNAGASFFMIGNSLLLENAFAVAGNYRISVSASSIVDLAGNAAGSDINLNLTVSGGTDSTAPALATVLTYSSSGVDPGASPVFVFSEPLTRGTGNIELHYADGTLIESIPAAKDIPNGLEDYAIRAVDRVYFPAPNDLHSGTAYYYYFPAGAFTDSSGNPTPAFRYDFTTTGEKDTAAPLLTSSSPSDNATGVVFSTPLTFTFNEPVTLGSGSIEIHKVSDGSLVAHVDIGEKYLINSTAANSFTVNMGNYNNSVYESLDPATDYYILLSPGLVRDLSGNDFAGINTAQQLNFTTASVPGLASSSSPVVVSSPSQLAAGQTISFVHANQSDSQFALRAVSGSAGVFNYGTIRITSTINSVAYAALVDLGSGTFKNYGLIEATNLPDPVGQFTPAAVGISAVFTYVANGKTGVISATGDKAYGIRADGGTIANDGQIEVHGNDLAVGINIGENSEIITNTGSIKVVGATGEKTFGINSDIGDIISITNSGTIEVSATTRNNKSVAIANDGAGTLINHGKISAGIAYLEEGYVGFNTTIVNDGTIIGDLVLLGGTDKITNTGTITGTIDMTFGGYASDIFDGRGGTYTGTISTGAGDDQIWAGDGNAVINAGGAETTPSMEVGV